VKGHGIIHRFSEDIDIRIEPPPELHVKTGRNHSKQAHAESRRNFFDWPAKTIRIDSIEKWPACASRHNWFPSASLSRTRNSLRIRASSV
jgi:Nucleotidyl transferase AbiEii toxin, Type IV TA system